MKLRIADRILVAVAGVVLIACCAGMIAQLFFGVDLVTMAGNIFSRNSAKVRIALIALSAVLFLLGVYCVLVLFRHRRRKDKFIMQKTDNGELAISLKALENLVTKCIDQHEELKVQSQHLENQRDGLLIRIRGTVAGGISIPLTVEALQKQIKQYVTACSGVEVKGIQVRIESSGEDAKDAPFAIEAPASRPLLRSAEKQPEQETAEPEPAETVPPDETETVQPVQEQPPFSSIPIPEDDEPDDRPLHQRLFSPKAEPCIVPEPPKTGMINDKAESDSAVAENETEQAAVPEIATDPEEIECSTATEVESTALDGATDPADLPDEIPEITEESDHE